MGQMWTASKAWRVADRRHSLVRGKTAWSQTRLSNVVQRPFVALGRHTLHGLCAVPLQVGETRMVTHRIVEKPRRIRAERFDSEAINDQELTQRENCGLLQANRFRPPRHRVAQNLNGTESSEHRTTRRHFRHNKADSSGSQHRDVLNPGRGLVAPNNATSDTRQESPMESSFLHCSGCAGLQRPSTDATKPDCELPNKRQKFVATSIWMFKGNAEFRHPKLCRFGLAVSSVGNNLCPRQC
mmetsp:Transcript_78797/g.219033  ORF Transcript_78797/g.219033 Transcript_78797/m.219033 type:complete len:241 (-) Transcript_78797:1085-1807(-)